MKLRLYIASDHAGFFLKSAIKNGLRFSREGHELEWIDLGPPSEDRVDYPSFAAKLSKQVLEHASGDELLNPQGVLICGSGVGMSIAANRFKGIRAVLAFSPEVAEISRQHNASNVLCLGARFLKEREAMDIVDAWLEGKFEGDRHKKRVDLIDDGSNC